MSGASESSAAIVLPSPRDAGAILTIDADALRSNYAIIKNAVPKAEVAAVVKADAYGIGLEPASRVFSEAGCKTFFVAHGFEGVSLRKLLPNARIFVLNGAAEGLEPIFLLHNLVPVLNSLSQIGAWRNLAKAQNRSLDVALHIDTGMNRLGLSPADCQDLADPQTLKGLHIVHVMSHLACADQPAHEMNKRQLALFNSLRKTLCAAPASLANSAASLSRPDFHLDMVRVGIALYGGNPFGSLPNPMRTVATLKARILQRRESAEGETVGYGATYALKKTARLATAAIGYADGLPRLLSNRGRGYFSNGGFASIVGRVSMDSITLDVSDLPEEACTPETWVEVMGAHVGVDEVADLSETISYEILTGITSRVAREYVNMPQ